MEQPFKPKTSRWDAEQTICFCHNVTYARILQAIQAGATTLEKLQEETFASTGCGGCQGELLEILEAIAEETKAK